MPTFSVFCLAAICPPSPLLLAPAVRVAHANHLAQNLVPGVLAFHHGVREHAAIPADVAHRLGEVATVVAKPVTGMLGDIEPAIGIVDLTMPAGLFVIAGAEGRAIVLRDVEVIGPG